MMIVDKNIETLQACDFDELTARLNVREHPSGGYVQYLFFAANPSSGEIFDISPKCKVYQEENVVAHMAVIRASLLEEGPCQLQLFDPTEVPDTIKSVLEDSFDKFNETNT